MDFVSPTFLFLFLPVFFLIYSLPFKQLKLLLGIAGSFIFYAWGNSQYAFWIIGLILFAYIIGRLQDWQRGKRSALFIMWGGIFLVMALLVGFKIRTDLAYPLGLSYVTFQVISYFVDVQKSSENCENDFLKFSFYLFLFPKILVGPIVPYRQVRPQLDELRSDPQVMADGLRRFLTGFAKKILIADTLGTVVTPIFALESPVVEPGIAWLVIISYSLQLYYDFSGYTDMAIGLSNMMGVRLTENFNAPYLSKSISDFWRRWHISLSTWFREIVFYPLERRRFKWYGQQINIMVVFILTGLWHGLNRNFLIWGVLHGAALVFESTPFGRKLRNLWLPLQHIYALSVIIVGWVIFRSPTPDFAYDYFRRLVGDMRGIQILPFEMTSPLPFIEPTFLIALVTGALLCLPWSDWFNQSFLKIYKDHFILRFVSDTCLIFIFLAALASTASASYRPGIYGGF